MSVQMSMSPRERMFMAKKALLEDEQSSYKSARRESRRLSHAISSNSDFVDDQPVASCSTPSKPGSSIRPASILRKSSLNPSSPSYEIPLSPKYSETSTIPSTPAPSLPLPPAPLLSGNTDSGPPIHLPSPSTPTSYSIRRRSSRVRFSDQQLQPDFNPNQALLVSRSTSLKGLRRESSIDGLRADLMQASSSLNGRKLSNTSNRGQNQSLTKRISVASIGSSNHRDSIASSINSDPFNWATSSFGSNHSDLDIGSELDIGSRKQSLSITFPDLNSEIEFRINDEEEQDGQGFRPQVLPYPKVSKALSRLSVESTNSSVWLTQDHDQDSNRDNRDSSIFSNSTSIDYSPMLKSALERSSLDSSISNIINLNLDGSRKSSQFSLDAKIRSGSNTLSIPDSRKSSYAPSATPSSLRSSLSENELPTTTMSSISISIDDRNNSNASSISTTSFQLPTRAQTIAYSSLLPSRRRRSSLLSLSQIQNGTMKSEHLPNLNRGEWDDPELGLSPRSGPIRLLGSLSSVSNLNTKSRRGTKLAEEIIIQSSPEVEQSPEKLSYQSVSSIEIRQDSIDLLPPIISPVESTDHVEQAEINIIHRSHTRSDSTFSAIMDFPIPPERIVEVIMGAEKPEHDDAQDQMMQNPIHDTDVNLPGDTEEGLVGDRIIQIPLEIGINAKSTFTMSDESVVYNQETVQSTVISLNSPFTEYCPTIIGQSMQVELIETEQVNSLEPDDMDTPQEVATEVAEAIVHSVSCPSSPELETVLRSTSRPRHVRGFSEGYDLTETEESDLDIASPLVQVALESRILTPRSKLLSPSPSPRLSRPSSIRSVSANSITTLSSLRSGLGLTSGRGWSGSESEEEDWISTVRQIKERKSISRSQSPRTPELKGITRGKRRSEGLTIQVKLEEEEIENEETPTMIKPKRFSASSITSISSDKSKKSNTNRYSQLSEISTTTTTSSTAESNLPLTPNGLLEILTPSNIVGLSRTNSSSSSIGGASSVNQPGNFPWGKSSPPNSPIRGLFINNSLSPTKEFFTSFRNISRKTSAPRFRLDDKIDGGHNVEDANTPRSRKELPEPTRSIEDWGEPEILIDDTDQDSDFDPLQLHADDDDLYPESDNENNKVEVQLKSLSLRSSISSLSLRSASSVLNDKYGGGSRRSTVKVTPPHDSSIFGSDERVEERSASPELWMDIDGERNLMDEEMPDMYWVLSQAYFK